MEIWKDVVGFEGLYKVSSLGRIKSLDKKVRCRGGFATKNGKVLKIKITKRKGAEGYHEVSLRKDFKYTHTMVHRIVALAFIPNQENKAEVNHKLGVRGDNRPSQLEWLTKQENMKHAYDRGSWDNMDNPNKGSLNHNAKLTESKVRMIRLKYKLGGTSTRKLAEKFGVHHKIIHDIIRRKRWAHVK